MKDLTHETCSELLGPFASGTLGAPERGAVEAHLATCSDCSLELAGIRALTTAGVEPLTGFERDQIAQAVRAGIAVPAKRSWSESFGRRAAPALGAVAVLAIAAIAVVSLPADDRPSPASGARDAPVPDAFDSAPTATGDSASQAQSEQLNGAATYGGGAATNDSAVQESQGRSKKLGAGTSETAADTALVTRAGVVLHEEPFAIAGLNLSSLVPPQIPERFAGHHSARALSRSAPDARVASLIRDCAARTIATSPFPLVATSAAYYSPDDVLVIGFSWVEESTGRLHYLMRGWRDGRCDRVSPIFLTGELE